MLELAIMVLAAFAVWDLYKAFATHTRRNFIGRILVTIAALGIAALTVPWPEWVALGLAVSVTAVKAGPLIIERLVNHRNSTPFGWQDHGTTMQEEEEDHEGRA